MFRSAVARLFTAFTVGLPLGGVALATDGVLEINQTCAVNTGCFSGDTAGFPVTIDGSAGTSYRLTGDLSVSDVNTHAIQLTTSGMTVDLGGFQISGPITCTGSGSTLSCDAPGSGNGVHFAPGGGTGGVVRNGTIRGMGLHGVGSGLTYVRVEDVIAIENGGDGIDGSDGLHVVRSTAIQNANTGIRGHDGSLIESSLSVGNGNHGVNLNENSVVRALTSRNNAMDGVRTLDGASVSETTSSGNDGSGFILGARSKYRSNTSRDNTSADDCGGYFCAERPRILNIGGVNGGYSCPVGFHRASTVDLDSGVLAWGGNKSDSNSFPGNWAGQTVNTAWIMHPPGPNCTVGSTLGIGSVIRYDTEPDSDRSGSLISADWVWSRYGLDEANCTTVLTGLCVEDD